MCCTFVTAAVFTTLSSMYLPLATVRDNCVGDSVEEMVDSSSVPRKQNFPPTSQILHEQNRMILSMNEMNLTGFFSDKAIISIMNLRALHANA